MLLRYVEPVSRGTELRAYIVGTLSPSALHLALEALSQERFRRADRLLAVDDHFALVAASDARRPGTSLAAMDLWRHTSLRTSAFQSTVGETVEYRDGAEGPSIGSIRTLPSRRWSLVVTRPESEAYRDLTAAQRALAAALGALVVLGLGAGVFLGARTTRPIGALVELTRAYARRRFEEKSAVRTGDELETLGDAMGDMAREILIGEAEIARRAKVEDNLSRFLPAEIAKQVAAGERSIALGGERRRVTVLFADMVAFTEFAERAPPRRSSRS